MIRFHSAAAGVLQPLDATVPDGALVGILGVEHEGPALVLRLAAGVLAPESGTVECAGPRAFLHPDDQMQLPEDTRSLLIHQTLNRCDAIARAEVLGRIARLRGNGTSVLLYSHDEELLLRHADEVWCFAGGKLLERGDPSVAIAAWRKHVAAELRARGKAPEFSRRARQGDGRAEITAIELIGNEEKPTSVWRSGEPAAIRVRVRFRAAVTDPVAGILIRTRVGLNVYGTNTELEKLTLGPLAAGDEIAVEFRFRCDLCPGEYTVTAASHDPDGQWHEWLEDAVAFAVVDDRYTAGVANLRAQVQVSNI